MDEISLSPPETCAIAQPESFKVIAVVDWISFVVKLRSASHGGYLKRAHEGVGVSRAIPLNAGPGGAATEFKVELQHPARYRVVHELLLDLELSHGIVEAPSLTGVEVSLDLWPRASGGADGDTLTKRLMIGIKPPVIENPRLVDGAGSVVLPTGNDIDPAKTLYIGNKSHDLLWRIYWKRTDETFLGEEGRRMPNPLPESEWRARAEVRIQGNALDSLDLATPMDLNRFPFQRLNTRGYFKFCAPAPGIAVLKENPWAEIAARSLGVDENSPACVLGRFACFDGRGRRRGSRYLMTDTKMTEFARTALRNLTRRFHIPPEEARFHESGHSVSDSP